MKKSISAGILYIILFLCLALCFSGCSSDGPNTSGKKILCADFSEYDWTRNILGDNPGNIGLDLLCTTGVDMHSFQPSAADFVKMSNCSLFVYAGGISEYWIDEAFKSSHDNSQNKIVCLMDVFCSNDALSKRYQFECQEHEHEHEDEDTHQHKHEHEDGDADEHEHDHEHEVDEHLWLSLKMAPVFCNEICTAVCELDPENSQYYKNQTKEYVKELEDLDYQFDRITKKSNNKSLLFADRFPFHYMEEDYNLTCYAAFPGCSAETEASFDTIISLSDKMKSENLNSIIILKNSKVNLANVIINASQKKNSKILVMDSIQSVTEDEIKNGYTFTGAMKNNLNTLTLALE